MPCWLLWECQSFRIRVTQRKLSACEMMQHNTSVKCGARSHSVHSLNALISYRRKKFPGACVSEPLVSVHRSFSFIKKDNCFLWSSSAEKVICSSAGSKTSFSKLLRNPYASLQCILILISIIFPFILKHFYTYLCDFNVGVETWIDQCMAPYWLMCS